MSDAQALQGGGIVSLVEELADSEHDRWSGWMRHLFGKSWMFFGYCIIPRAYVKRWKRQMNTSYCNLSEREKDSDRTEANRTIAIMVRHNSLSDMAPAAQQSEPVTEQAERQKDTHNSRFPERTRLQVLHHKQVAQ